MKHGSSAQPLAQTRRLLINEQAWVETLRGDTPAGARGRLLINEQAWVETVMLSKAMLRGTVACSSTSRRGLKLAAPPVESFLLVACSSTSRRGLKQ